MRHRVADCISESERGELCVSIPSSVHIVRVKQERADSQQQQQTEATATVDGEFYTAGFIVAALHSSYPRIRDVESKGEDAYEPFIVRIVYSADSPVNGMQFVLPDPATAPTRPPHLYVCGDRSPGVTRCWMPCLDRASECGTWELAFNVPAEMEMDVDGSAMTPVSVICNGELVEQMIPSDNLHRRIFRFEMLVPVSAPMICFAIGCFERMTVGAADASTTGAEDATARGARGHPDIPILAFGPIGRAEEVNHDCRYLGNTVQSFVKEIGSYPFASFAVVFVDEAPCTLMVGAGLVIQGFDTTRVLALSVALQWFGAYITPATWNDAWLVEGMAEYLCAAYLKRLMGTNEYRYRLKKDIERVCDMDVDRPPIGRVGVNRAPSADDMAFIRLKAPLVLFMLDKRMLKGGPSLGLNRVIPKIMLSAMSGELGVANAVATAWFIRICRKVSGIELKTFATHTFSAGCPIFHFRYAFNRKKMVVEINMTQESTAQRSLNILGRGTTDATPPTLFTGQMTARVREADGTPYEHVLDIQEPKKKFEVQFNTKYKRIRRTTKRFQARQAAAAAEDASADAEVSAELQEGEWIAEDDEETKRAWRIVEWGEEDEESTASGTFEWIRMDSDFEWVCVMDFYQPDFMWAAQLLNDRDVVAQYEATAALAMMPSSAVSTSLMRIVMDPKCFYRVRMDAALSLAKCATPDSDYIGFHHLTKIYEWRYGFSLSALLAREATMPRTNDFSNFSEYFVQKVCVACTLAIASAPLTIMAGHYYIHISCARSFWSLLAGCAPPSAPPSALQR
ncbi:hypothetical protein THASP1DRAFT_17902 [Thamnocephalis sphaerospora]|uniref:Transcription initiation factor TFIID subunit 2 n=1 Tax=Thamnocephalis sphaerospora TaxID=78915 RepID=A0A4P9XM07_9FUNG|nr:hypothetical protein THASP1DRAFT_17902 [Thamnocephalis sphaerospora]|eukprot:RKP06866.1 hypothetical protein THASP1DRAFT_17902 [Thamnocephalis sphaerospora]